MATYNIPQLTNHRLYSGLILQARRLGVGNSLSRQKFTISDDDQQLLDQILGAWDVFHELLDFGAALGSSADQGAALVRAVQRKEIRFTAVFCPSYQLGSGAVGYNRQIGRTSRANLDLLGRLRRQLEAAGVVVTIQAYFSDLLLENFDLLQGTSYRDDLQANYRSFQEFAEEQGVASALLSSLAPLAETIGEAGASVALPDVVIEPDSLAVVRERNRVFYEDQLGWTEPEIVTRSQVLATSYPHIAQAINNSVRPDFYYWSESAFERARLMPNLAMPIMFPKKSQLFGAQS